MMRRILPFFLLFVWASSAQEAEETLLRVRALAETFGQFENKSAAVGSLAILGNVTCRYHKDSGITVLRQACSVLLGAEFESDEYERLRLRLMRSANRCDAELADELLSETESPDADSVTSAKTALSAAFARAREDPARAAEIAASALGALPSMNHYDARSVSRLANVLHNQDPQVAADLFRQALSSMEASPDGALAALQAMGNYPFGPVGSLGGTAETGIDSVYVVDLAQRRSAVPDEMAVAYLKAAAGILARPVASQTEQTYRYTLAWQLAPHAEALAPELFPMFRGAMEGAGAALPERVRVLPAAKLGKTLEELMEASGQNPENDGSRMIAARNHYAAGEFDKAREVAAKIEDDDVRGRLMRLVALGETLRAIDEGAPTIGELTPPLLSSLAFLSLATRQFYEDGLPEDAALTLALAKTEIDKLDLSARPFLLLATARLEAAINIESALTTLGVAVSAFNALDEEPEKAPSREGSYTMVGDHGVTERLNVGRAFTIVRVRPSRIEGYRFETAIPVFLDADPARLESILASLESEKRRAEAQVYALELRLMRDLPVTVPAR